MDVTYRNWNDGQPDNKDDQQHCAVISRSWVSGHQWDDTGCATNQLAVCKQQPDTLHM